MFQMDQKGQEYRLFYSTIMKCYALVVILSFISSKIGKGIGVSIGFILDLPFLGVLNFCSKQNIRQAFSFHKLYISFLVF